MKGFSCGSFAYSKRYVKNIGKTFVGLIDSFKDHCCLYFISAKESLRAGGSCGNCMQAIAFCSLLIDFRLQIG